MDGILNVNTVRLHSPNGLHVKDLAVTDSGQVSFGGAVILTRLPVEHVIVGGGGGGSSGPASQNSGASGAGGGGGGGVLTGRHFCQRGTSYPVVIGAGGASAGTNWNTPGFNGGDTTVLGKTAYGGGGGKSQAGASGGGAQHTTSGGTAIEGQGHIGGDATYGNGGGGGGAGREGWGQSTGGSKGGDGLQVRIRGTLEYFGGGGGGGGAQNSTAGGLGGLGGGGTGSIQNSSNVAKPGSANTGGGGGGGNDGGGQGGAGGSGIVIIGYPGDQQASGGTVTQYGEGAELYTCHTFTESGTFAVY